jgi:hypothetical protein
MQHEQVGILLRNLLDEITPETSHKKFRNICCLLQKKYHPDHGGDATVFKMGMSQIKYLEGLEGNRFTHNWFECWKKSTDGIEFIYTHRNELEQAHGDKRRGNQRRSNQRRSNQGGRRKQKTQENPKHKTKLCRYGEKCQSGDQCTFIHQYDDNQGGEQKNKDCFEEVTTVIENHFRDMDGIQMISLTKCKKFEGYFAVCKVNINDKRNRIYIQSCFETAIPFDFGLRDEIKRLEIEQTVQ